MSQPSNVDVALAAYPVFRRAVKAAVPWPVWLMIGKWLFRVLVWALEAGLFGQRQVAAGGMAPPDADMPEYSPEIRKAIVAEAIGLD